MKKILLTAAILVLPFAGHSQSQLVTKKTMITCEPVDDYDNEYIIGVLPVSEGRYKILAVFNHDDDATKDLVSTTEVVENTNCNDDELCFVDDYDTAKLIIKLDIDSPTEYIGKGTFMALSDGGSSLHVSGLNCFANSSIKYNPKQ